MFDPIKNFIKMKPYIQDFNSKILDRQDIRAKKITVNTIDGEITVYLYPASKKSGCVFEFHGGGFVFGDARADHEICEKINKALDINVISVDYRLAPEFIFPTAGNDGKNVVEYFFEHAKDYNMENTKFSLLGFSAGANITTVIAKDWDEDIPLKNLVINYPYLDAATDPRDKQSYESGLDVETMEIFTKLYTPDMNLKDENISPLYMSEEKVKKLPRTLIITAECDGLRSEAELFFERIKNINVEAKICMAKDMHHGFMEDFFNHEIYDAKPADSKRFHSKNMGKEANNALNTTIEWLKASL